MPKQIYICEFCGKLQTMHFGQCRYCDTHEDGTRYKHYQKEEVKKISKQEMLEHIKNINDLIDGNINGDEMDKKYVDDKIDEVKKRFDTILDNRFKNIDLKNLNEIHKNMEHSCDNEINNKIIEDKLNEIKELKEKNVSLNENLQLKIKELNEKRKQFEDLIVEKNDLQGVISDLQGVISKLKQDKGKKQVNQKTSGWSELEDFVIIKTQKDNKNLKGKELDELIMDNLKKKNFFRTLSAIQTRRIRLKKK